MASAAPKYDLYSDAFRRDTYGTFARMREQDPVLCQPGIDGETPIWFVTRYDDAEALLDDERFVRDPRLALPHDLRALFAERRRQPGEDLVSALVAVEDGGDTLSEEELSSMVALLIVAGHETTVSLIGNATLALLTHPEQRAVLERDPSLLPRAVEELIRYDGPVEGTLNRWAAEDVELRGRKIRRGDLVIVVLGAADRDPERFAQPDTLDPAAEQKPRHLGFGRGSHFCLGAPLARLEAAIALETLPRRLPGLRLAVAEEELGRRPVPLFRSLVALPAAWDT